MKKAVCLLVQSAGVISLWGAVTTVTDVSKMPVSGNEGLIKYTGVTGTVETDLALTPAAKKASTFEVQSSDTELTFSGKLSTSQGAFIKSGPGLLKLAYPGAYTLGASGAESQKVNLMWASDGVASQGFAALTVADGTLELGAPGSSVTVSGGATVGARHSASSAPEVKVKGGTFKAAALYLDRGYSTASRNIIYIPIKFKIYILFSPFPSMFIDPLFKFGFGNDIIRSVHNSFITVCNLSTVVINMWL